MSIRRPGRLKDVRLADVLRRDTAFWGNALMDLVDATRVSPLRALWNQNPARYPFYSSFVEGIAYFGFHAGVLQHERFYFPAWPERGSGLPCLSSSHGFTTGTPAATNGAVSRVATVNP